MSVSNDSVNRRDFLKTATAVGSSLGLANSAFAALSTFIAPSICAPYVDRSSRTKAVMARTLGLETSAAWAEAMAKAQVRTAAMRRFMLTFKDGSVGHLTGSARFFGLRSPRRA